MHTQSQPYIYHSPSRDDPYGAANDFDFSTSLHGVPFSQDLNAQFQSISDFQGQSSVFQGSVFDQNQAFGRGNIVQGQHLDLSAYDAHHSPRRDSRLQINTRHQPQAPVTINSDWGGRFGTNIQDIFYPGLQENVSAMAATRQRAPAQSPSRRQTRSSKQSRRGDSVLSSPETSRVGKGASSQQDAPPPKKPQRTRASNEILQTLPAVDMSDKLLLKIAALGMRKRFYQVKKYREYRLRIENSQTSPWPEEIEVAFIEACVVHRPDARSKQTQGRNERISSYIFSVTGECRPKKMITSHLQVLKAWVDGQKSDVIDSLALSCITKDDGGKWVPMPLVDRPWHEIIQELFMEVGYYSGEQDRLRNRFLDSPYHKTSSHGGPQISGPVGVLIPEAYEMILTSNESTLPHPIHNFAVTAKNPKHKYMGLKDWALFVQRYPELGALQQTRPLNCDVVLAHTAIGRPQDDWTPYGRSRLAVSGGLRLETKCLSAGAELATTTTIYHAKIPFMTFESRGTVQASRENACAVEIPSWSQDYFPEFVSVEAAVIGKDKDKQSRDDEELPQAVDGTSEYTMTQEIDIITPTGERTRVLVVHHKFDTWRPVEKHRGGKRIYLLEGETRWQQMHISDRLQEDTADEDLSMELPEPATTQLDTSWVNVNGIRVGQHDTLTPASASRTTSGSWTTPSSASGDVKPDLLFTTPTSSTSSMSGIDSWLDPQLQGNSIASLPDTIHPLALSTPTGSGMVMGQHQFGYPSQGMGSLDMYSFDQSDPFQQTTPSRGQYGGNFLGDFGQ